MNTEEKIIGILLELCEDDIVSEDHDVELFDSGLMDSLAFTELLVDIENELHVVIAPSEIDRASLNTPAKIISVVNSKLA